MVPSLPDIPAYTCNLRNWGKALSKVEHCVSLKAKWKLLSMFVILQRFSLEGWMGCLLKAYIECWLPGIFVFSTTILKFHFIEVTQVWKTEGYHLIFQHVSWSFIFANRIELQSSNKLRSLLSHFTVQFCFRRKKKI